MKKSFWPLLLLLLLLSDANSHKILVYSPRFGHSVSNFMGAIADTLVDAGHDVTTLIPIFDTKIADGTTRSKIIHVPPSAAAAAAFDTMQSAHDDVWNDEIGVVGAFMSSIPAQSTKPKEQSISMANKQEKMGRMFRDMFCGQCESTLKLVEQLRKEHFDVLINENFDFCGMGLAHALGVKATIITTSCSIFDNVAYDLGIPVVPSYNPNFYTMSLDVHSLWSRAANTLNTHLTIPVFDTSKHCIDALMTRTYGADYPSISQQTAAAAFVFTNSEPFIDMARPLLRKVVDLGGIGRRQPQPLDKNWQQIASLRNQTVLLSFGSFAKSVSMEEERKRAWLRVIRKFPNVTFVWKYEEPDDDFATSQVAKVANVVLSKWIPQNDLLGSGRVTAFISHGGLNSCLEAAANGVPGIFIPLFGDQPRNAMMMEEARIGIAFAKADVMNEWRLSHAVQRLLTSEDLATMARRTAAMLAGRPFSQREQLVRHVEFAAEFGAASALHPRGVHLSWIEYFLVDVIVVAIVAVSAVSALAVYAAIAVYRAVKRRNEMKKNE